MREKYSNFLTFEHSIYLKKNCVYSAQSGQNVRRFWLKMRKCRDFGTKTMHKQAVHIQPLINQKTIEVSGAKNLGGDFGNSNFQKKRIQIFQKTLNVVSQPFSRIW